MAKMEIDCNLIKLAIFSKFPTGLKRGGGGGKGAKKFNTERLRPEVRPLTLLYTIFGRKGTPFVNHPLENNERSF